MRVALAGALFIEPDLLMLDEVRFCVCVCVCLRVCLCLYACLSVCVSVCLCLSIYGVIRSRHIFSNFVLSLLPSSSPFFLLFLNFLTFFSSNIP